MNRFKIHPQTVASALLFGTAIIALLALVGIATHNVTLRTWVKGTVPIKEITSWLLFYNAVAGFLICRPDRRAFTVPIGLLVLITVAMLSVLVNEIVHLENLASYDPKASYFSSLAMAVGNVLLAARAVCALIFRSKVPSLCFSAGVAGIGACALLGYALDCPCLYFFIPGYVTALAVPTSVAFVLLGLLPIPDAKL